MKKTVLLAIAILTMLACSTPQPEKVTLIWDQGYSALPFHRRARLLRGRRAQDLPLARETSSRWCITPPMSSSNLMAAPAQVFTLRG